MRDQFVRLSQAGEDPDHLWMTVICNKAAQLPNHEHLKMTVEKNGDRHVAELVVAMDDFVELCETEVIPETVRVAFDEANAVLYAHDEKRAARGGPLWVAFVMSQVEKGEPAAIAGRKVWDNPDVQVFVIRGLAQKPPVCK